jgi:hypothetical protein
MVSWNYDGAEIEDNDVGDIILLQGKSYKITKKTSTALSIIRWYWFDRMFEKLGRKFERR